MVAPNGFYASSLIEKGNHELKTDSEFVDFSKQFLMEQDLHFEYMLDGKLVKGKNISGKFVFRSNNVSTQYWYDCKIERPAILKIDQKNLEGSVTKIYLVFSSKYEFKFEFDVTKIYLE